MNVVLVSESFIIREGLKNVFTNILENVDIVLKDNIKKLQDSELLNSQLILLDIEGDSSNIIESIKYIKSNYEKIKLMILDRNKNKALFRQSIKYGIEGYIANIDDENDFLYSVNKIMNGKNIYDSDIIQSIFTESNDDIEKEDVGKDEIQAIELLSKREKEVLYKVAEGLDNKTIADDLYITEYTVKKHIKSIFDKLGLKNRKEVIVYMLKVK